MQNLKKKKNKSRPLRLGQPSTFKSAFPPKGALPKDAFNKVKYIHEI